MVQGNVSKPHYTEFKLGKSEAVVQVQSTLDPPKKGGIAEASGAGDRARETWEEGLVLVREMASGVMSQLKEATAEAESVTVEFGVNISSKVGVVMVEGEACANLKVTMTWKGRG